MGRKEFDFVVALETESDAKREKYKDKNNQRQRNPKIFVAAKPVEEPSMIISLDAFNSLFRRHQRQLLSEFLTEMLDRKVPA